MTPKARWWSVSLVVCQIGLIVAFFALCFAGGGSLSRGSVSGGSCQRFPHVEPSGVGWLTLVVSTCTGCWLWHVPGAVWQFGRLCDFHDGWSGEGDSPTRSPTCTRSSTP
jgi:hypothetical protein